MEEFSGKVALVTGGGRGVGAAICQRLASGGAQVVVADRDLEPAEEIAAGLIGQGLAAASIRLDVSRADEIERSVTAIKDVFGPVDILVNNAGITRHRPLLELSEHEWDQHHDVMLKGVFLMSKAFLPDMVERRSGRSLNMCSALGRQGVANYAAYSSAKFGVIGLTQVIASEFGRYDITANCVVPGVVKTRLWHGETGTVAISYGSEEAAEAFIQTMIPLARAQDASDIAEMVAFLASEKARNMTAGTYHVDGGLAPR